MGSLFSPKVETPPPPQPIQYVNTRDEVAGTQSNYVTAPDGTKTLVTTRLPLTPEEQAYEDNLKQIASQSLDWINKLSTNYDRSQIPWLDQYLKDYETTQVQGLNKATADQTQQSETALARFGQADSTAGTEDRAQRGQQYINARGQITRDLSSIEQNARQNELGNAQNLYALATGRQDAILGQLAGSLGRSQQFQLADGSNQMAYNTQIYNANAQNAALKAQSNSSALTNLATLGALGVYAAGPSGFNVLSKLGTKMLSDRRTKTDIKKVGVTSGGNNIYRFRYKAGGPMQLGVIAQEVEKRNPKAVTTIGGVKLVDYAKVK